jgi:Icc-related predicted phosphoesterase
MIIDILSDLHGHRPTLEGGDLLIIAGDFNARENYSEYLSLQQWLNEQNYDKIILVAGNHDTLILDSDVVDDVLYEHTYLQDSGTTYNGLKIWGSPWTKKFKGMNPNCMAFTCDTDEQLAEKFSLIPHDVDILITHSPPYTILDRTVKGIQVGATFLMGALIYCFRPRLWAFGHVHESYGKQMYKDMTHCVNASYVDEKYRPVNKPIRIEL